MTQKQRAPRKLYFLPIQPGNPPRIREALQNAKTIADAKPEPGKKVPVFALQDIQMGVPSGVEVVNMCDEGISILFDAAVLCSCIMTHNASNWASQNPQDENAQEFMDELSVNGAVSMGCIPSMSDSVETYRQYIEAGYKANLEMMSDAGASFFAKKWGEVGPQIDAECTKIMYSPLVSDGLRSIIQNRIISPILNTIKEVSNVTIPAMQRFFCDMANEVDASEEAGPQKRNFLAGLVDILGSKITAAVDTLGAMYAESENPIITATAASLIVNSMATLNSIAYTYKVAGADFSEGVMNAVWEEGGPTEDIIKTLEASGIEVHTKW